MKQNKHVLKSCKDCMNTSHYCSNVNALHIMFIWHVHIFDTLEWLCCFSFTDEFYLFFSFCLSAAKEHQTEGPATNLTSQHGEPPQIQREKEMEGMTLDTLPSHNRAFSLTSCCPPTWPSDCADWPWISSAVTCTMRVRDHHALGPRMEKFMEILSSTIM